MSILGKMESGYLQLTRILLLGLATLALIISIVLGINALQGYKAQPAKVSEVIDINPTSFRVDDGTSKDGDSSASARPGAAKQSAMADVIIKHGKALVGPDFVFDKSSLDDIVDSAMSDPDRGEAFLTGETTYLDRVLSRADVTKQAKTSEAFFNVASEVLDQYRTAYAEQQQRISDAKEKAKSDAEQKGTDATMSLYVLGALFWAFIMMVLLIVQLRIERSIRVISESRAPV